MELYSINLERKVLGGLLKNPELYLKISTLLNFDDFYVDVHKTIFKTIGIMKVVEKTLLSQKLKEFGIKTKDGIDIFDYIDALDFTQISQEALILSSKEIRTLSIKRIIKSKLDYISQSINYSKSAAELAILIYDTYIGEIEPMIEINKPVDITSKLNNNEDYEVDFINMDFLYISKVSSGSLISIYPESKIFLSLDDIYQNFLLQGYLNFNVLHLDAVNKITNLFPVIKSVKNKLELKFEKKYDFYNVENKTANEIGFVIKKWIKNQANPLDCLVILNTHDNINANYLKKLAIELKCCIIIQSTEPVNADIIIAVSKFGHENKLKSNVIKAPILRYE